jgi:pilus assembly protein Flp/PilA
MANVFLKFFAEFCKEEEGATAVEYAIMLVLIITVVIVTVGILGEKTSNSFNKFNETFQPT